jgi:hypothetical protein
MSQSNNSRNPRRVVLVALLVIVGGWCCLIGATYLASNPEIVDSLRPARAPERTTPAPSPTSPTSTPTFTHTPEPTATPRPTATPVPTATPTVRVPTPTPPPTETATPLPAGCLGSTYVADVTIPDNTRLDPGEAFVKTWRVRNTGTCPWPGDTTIIFIRGADLDAPASVEVGTLDVNGTTEISVDMVAPTAAGRYEGTWRLADSNGQPFGTTLTVVIRVDADC